MIRLFCASLPLLVGLLSAQSPPPPRPEPRPPQLGSLDKTDGPAVPFLPRERPREVRSAPTNEASDALQSATAAAAAFALDPNQVWVDRPAADGPVWACSRDWKASFDSAACTFFPFFGANAPRNFPLRLEVAALRVGDTLLPIGPAAVTIGERYVDSRRDAVVERFALDGRGIEQRFVFAQLPARGELVIEIAATSELTPRDTGAGLEFGNDFGSVTYGAATAIAADGASCPVVRTFENGRIRLAVPAPFVKRAALPLVVDPWVTGSAAVVTQGETAECRPDVAYDAIAQQYVAVWQREYSYYDYDVWVQRFTQNVLTGAVQLVGNPIAVDYTAADWRRPKIANVRAAQIYLVVAEVGYGFPGNTVYWIGGRTMNTGGGMSYQIDIERGGVVGLSGNNFAPSVGGDAYPTGPSYFTVVWEHEFSATDHDIYAKQVTTTATLRSTQPTPIDISGYFEGAPAISRVDGTTDPATQRWFIGYHRHVTPTNTDIYGAMLSWDGQIVPWGTALVFPVATGPTDDWFPVVSSPTNMQGNYRYALYSYYEGNPTSGGLVVVNHYGYIAGQFGFATTLGSPASDRVVDCDGTRFTVGWNSNSNVHAATLAFLDGAAPALRVDDHLGVSPAVLTGTVTNVALTASHGSGAPDTMACVYDVTSGTWPTVTSGFEARFYLSQATGGGMVQRATNCGGLPIYAVGVPAIAHSLTFNMLPSGPLHGFLFGTPVNVPLGFLGNCPCTLGVDGSVVADPFPLTIPALPTLVGLTFAVQGFDFTSGPCFGTIALSDTIDFTIR